MVKLLPAENTSLHSPGGCFVAAERYHLLLVWLYPGASVTLPFLVNSLEATKPSTVFARQCSLPFFRITPIHSTQALRESMLASIVCNSIVLEERCDSGLI